MGLIDHIMRRAHVWSWRARFWWYDTPHGQIAEACVFASSAIVAMVMLVRLYILPQPLPETGEPAKAIVWWVQLLVMVIAAAISYAMRPKPQQPKPQASEAPQVEDGLAAKHYFGTCWVTDEFLLAWKQTGTEPIQSKGGKK